MSVDLVLNTGCRSQLKQNVSSCKLESWKHLLGSVKLGVVGKEGPGGALSW